MLAGAGPKPRPETGGRRGTPAETLEILSWRGGRRDDDEGAEKFEFRTGGPNYFRDFWVFVIGPVTGATVAAAYYKVINAMQDKEAENEPADRADAVKPVEA